MVKLWSRRRLLGVGAAGGLTAAAGVAFGEGWPGGIAHAKNELLVDVFHKAEPIRRQLVWPEEQGRGGGPFATQTPSWARFGPRLRGRRHLVVIAQCGDSAGPAFTDDE